MMHCSGVVRVGVTHAIKQGEGLENDGRARWEVGVQVQNSFSKEVTFDRDPKEVRRTRAMWISRGWK